MDKEIIGLYKLTLFVGYFVAGYMIHNQQIPSLRLSGYQLILISAVIALTSACLVNFYTPISQPQQFYDPLVSPYFVLMIIGSLMIFQYFREHEDFFTSRPKLGKIISKVGALIYGGYLVHILFREHLKIFFFVLDGTFYAGNYLFSTHIICALLTMILTLLVVAIFYNIPYLRRLV